MRELEALGEYGTMPTGRWHVLIDVDHTLSNAFDRQPMADAKEWDNYHSASLNDKPVKDITNLIAFCGQYGCTLVGLTTRPEKWRAVTVEWLLRNEVYLDEIIMRPNDDFRPAAVVKIDQAIKRFGSEQGVRDNVAFIIDDNDKVVEAFRALGITVLQCFARRLD